MTRASPAIRNAFIFYVMALALAIFVRLLVPWIGEASLPLTMLTPALAVVFMMAAVAREGGWRSALSTLGLTTAGWKAWPFAIIAPLLIHGVGIAVLVGFGLTAFVPPSAQGPVFFAVADALIGFAVGSAFAMGEEVGWRGYMLPRLLSLGPVAAMLIVGLLQGIWHMPLLLTTELYHSTGNPWIVAPMFLLTLTLAGIFFGFLRLWSGSVWPAAVAHGAVNTAWNLATQMSGTRSPLVLEYIGGESGVIVITGLLLFDSLIIAYMLRTGLISHAAQRS